MWSIVTDVERLLNHSAPRSPRSTRLLQRVGVPALTVVTVLASTVLGSARLAAGDAISDAKAKAAAIEAQLSQAQNEMSALSQQYDEAKYHLGQINSNISTTKANIAADQQQVSKDKTTLAKAAVANYISDGTAAAQNSIFSGSQETAGATNEYNQIAEGDISLAVDNLHTAENSLNAQVAQLQSEQSQAQSQVTAEQNAVAQNAKRSTSRRTRSHRNKVRSRSSSSSSKRLKLQQRHKLPRPSNARLQPLQPPLPPQPPRLLHRAVEAARPLPGCRKRHRRQPPPEVPERSRRPRARSACPTSGGASPRRARPAPASTARVSPHGPGARSASGCRTTRAPRCPTPPRYRSVTSSPVTSSSTVPVGLSTWRCTSARAK